MRKEDALVRPDLPLQQRLLRTLGFQKEELSPEESRWSSVVEQALEGKSEQIRAKAVRDLANVPIGLINAELFLDLMDMKNAISIRKAAAKTCLKRMEVSKQPTEFAFMGPRLAKDYLAEKDPQVKKLIDELFNEIHFSILAHLEESKAFGKKYALLSDSALAAFAATKPSVERKTYDRKYEKFLEQYVFFKKR